VAAQVHASGILTEPCEPRGCAGDAQIYKGVFAHGLSTLYGAVGDDKPGYRTFLQSNADSVWHVGRDRRNGFGLSWTGPARRVTAATQTSGALLLGATAYSMAAARDGNHAPR
jgi:hypothetical protein